MTAGRSDLIVVQPTDTVSAVNAKLQASGATTVQLLIAEANSAFQSREAWNQLAQAATQAGRSLTLFSADERTLSAAHQAQIEIIGIDRTTGRPPVVPLRAPANGETRSSSYATRSIDRNDLEQPIDPADASFLDTLDRWPDDRSLYQRLDDSIDDDFDDDPPSTPMAPRGTGRRVPIIDDDADEDEDDEPFIPARRSYEPTADVTPPGIRTRASTHGGLARTPARGRGAGYEPARRQAGGVLLPVLVGALLVLAFAGFLVFTNRPTITIWPPPTAVKTTAIQNEVIPVSATVVETAIRAVPLKSSAEVTVQGRASQQLTPVGVARGSVQIINKLGNPIELPAGTSFKAQGPNNQEVSFLLDAPATVPPAVSSTSLFGTSIQFGNIEVAISAQSKGSASNVGENSITQLVVPGQPPLPNSDQVHFLNKAIQGGSEEQRYIVAQPDVATILGSGLSQLYNAGITSLQQQQASGDLVLDPATVFPDPKALGDPVNYAQPVISPLIGAEVDQANPVFTMTLKADFTGLAAPAAQSVSKQLETFVPNYLQGTKKRCAPSEQFGTRVDRYVWNGQQLAIEGSITCTPAGVLPEATLAKARSAVVGQSRANAEAGLASLQQSGAIGGYQLPANLASFPGFDFLIQVERAAANSQPPQTPAKPAQAAPTTVAQSTATAAPPPEVTP